MPRYCAKTRVSFLLLNYYTLKYTSSTYTTEKGGLVARHHPQIAHLSPCQPNKVSTNVILDGTWNDVAHTGGQTYPEWPSVCKMHLGLRQPFNPVRRVCCYIERENLRIIVLQSSGTSHTHMVAHRCEAADRRLYSWFYGNVLNKLSSILEIIGVWSAIDWDYRWTPGERELALIWCIERSNFILSYFF